MVGTRPLMQGGLGLHVDVGSRGVCPIICVSGAIGMLPLASVR